MSTQNGRVSPAGGTGGTGGRPPGRKLPVKNPYTGEVDYEIIPPTPAELADICDSLRAAQVKWAAAPLEHRVEVMLRWADELDRAYGRLSAADFADTGGCLIALMSPRFVEPLMDTIRAVPELAEVFTFITGDARTGQQLIQQIDMLCFTGSVPNGRKVAVACAERLIPAYLELGGKDPAIVTATADLDAAATAVLRGAAFGTGQVCFSVERVYVHADAHDAFVAALVAKADAVRLNYPDINDGEIGPFGFDRQARIADEHLADALAKGAVLKTGGSSQVLGAESGVSGGHFMRPTVLIEVSHDMLVMTEESFAPIMPVMRYRTEDQAVALANDTHYGLSASVIAGTPEEAARIAERVNAGTIALQDTFLILFKTRDVGTSSFADSGLGGDRTGPGSILRFLRKKALMTQSAPPAPPAPLARPAPPAR